MQIKCEDFFPMDIGTSGFTGYETDAAVIQHMMDRQEELMKGLKLGHIHSHHNMNVYFSGTDQSELHDNAPNHNYYLSLIVNNKLETCAKLAILKDISNFNHTTKVLYIIDCNIIIEDFGEVSNSFADRLKEVSVKHHARKKPPVAKQLSTPIIGGNRIIGAGVTEAFMCDWIALKSNFDGGVFDAIDSIAFDEEFTKEEYTANLQASFTDLYQEFFSDFYNNNRAYVANYIIQELKELNFNNEVINVVIAALNELKEIWNQENLTDSKTYSGSQLYPNTLF